MQIVKIFLFADTSVLKAGFSMHFQKLYGRYLYYMYIIIIILLGRIQHALPEALRPVRTH